MTPPQNSITFGPYLESDFLPSSPSAPDHLESVDLLFATNARENDALSSALTHIGQTARKDSTALLQSTIPMPKIPSDKATGLYGTQPNPDRFHSTIGQQTQGPKIGLRVEKLDPR